MQDSTSCCVTTLYSSIMPCSGSGTYYHWTDWGGIADNGAVYSLSSVLCTLYSVLCTHILVLVHMYYSVQ